jgi:hypothetical protein
VAHNVAVHLWRLKETTVKNSKMFLEALGSPTAVEQAIK